MTHKITRFYESYKSSSPQKTAFVKSAIFLPSVISSDSTTFLVFFLFVDLGERLVVDLMG